MSIKLLMVVTVGVEFWEVSGWDFPRAAAGMRVCVQVIDGGKGSQEKAVRQWEKPACGFR